MKAALRGLNGGLAFNEAVAAQYHQAKKLEVQQLQNQVRENVETWETASVMYLPFEFSQVPVQEVEARKFVPLHTGQRSYRNGLEYSISEDLGHTVATAQQQNFQNKNFKTFWSRRKLTQKLFYITLFQYYDISVNCLSVAIVIVLVWWLI